jgi:MFS family permease
MKANANKGRKRGEPQMVVWKRNLTILWLGSFLSSVGMSMIIPFLPLYVQELGVHDMKEAALWAAFIFAANHIMIALVSPLWGKLSDIYGQKKMMIRSGIGMAVVIAAMGLVHTPLQLIFLRLAFGCVAGFSSSASALLAVETPREHAGKALGTLQTGNMSGHLLGPICGGLLAETYGMRSAFYLTGILILMATVLVIVGVKESRQYTQAEWGWLGKWRTAGMRLGRREAAAAGAAHTVTGAAAAVAAPAPEAAEKGAPTAVASAAVSPGRAAPPAEDAESALSAAAPKTAACAAASTGALADAPAGAPAEAPQTLLAVVKHSPVILMLFFSSFLISASLLSIEPVITLYVKSMNVERHVELMGGLVFASSALGTIISAPYLGRLGDRKGHAAVLIVSLLLMALLYIPQAWITDPWLLLTVRFATGLCMGGMLPAISALLRYLTPVQLQGSVFGYLSSANSLGNVSGALFGGFIANVFGISHIFYIIAVIFFLHFVMLIFSLRRLSPSAIRRYQSEAGIEA